MSADIELLRLAAKAAGIAGGYKRIHQTYGIDSCAATRRAIVRAAADIGRAMP